MADKPQVIEDKNSTFSKYDGKVSVDLDVQRNKDGSKSIGTAIMQEEGGIIVSRNGKDQFITDPKVLAAINGIGAQMMKDNVITASEKRQMESVIDQVIEKPNVVPKLKENGGHGR